MASGLLFWLQISASPLFVAELHGPD